MPLINKEDLAVIICKRLDGVVPKALVHDAIGIICDSLSDRLSEGKSIPINNFGVLDTYTYHGHEGVNISSGEDQYVESFVSVKFIPHENLLILLGHKKSAFKA
ncbi:hypothetical protein LCGC14_0459180 [marine sediment metagenome]|uniref:HU domain-containing protein n=1 Tax=marine sediment metagenome TaxID=412755 RepID=A0A0F9SKU0_9ZZZZ